MTLALDWVRPMATPASSLDPRWLLGGLAVAIGLASALSTFVGVTAGCLAAIGLTAVARLPAERVLLRLSFAAPFVILVAIPLPLIHGWPGFGVAAVVGMKAATVILLVLIGVAAVPPRTAFAAARSVGVPAELTTLVHLSYRYTFVIAEEFARVRRALQARGFRARATGRTYRTVGRVVASLVIRSGERGERVAAALQCRGGSLCVTAPVEFRTRAVDVAAAAGLAGLFAGLLIWERA